MTPTAKASLLAALLLLGCTTAEYRPLSVRPLQNDRGHVIGHKETLQHVHTGEQLERVTYFTPLLDRSGAVVGYEETIGSEKVVRDLQGRRVGVRFKDLRSGNTNQKDAGVSVIVVP